MQYCYDNFDVNKDGKVSKIEASAVAKIDLARQEIKTLTGIGYFSNLEILNCKECHELTTVDLSNNLKVRIGDEMFYTCSKLSKIVLPNNILEIGESAFYGCSSLKNIDIPDKVTEIGYSAFYGCSSLKNIDIPDKVTEIGDSAFRRCSSLMSINIPKEVTEIGRQAFGSCVSLTSINIPKRVTRLEDLFSNCSSLRSVTFEKGSQLKYIFGGLYSSYDGMFCNCEALTSIEIPASVEMIKGCIFNNCSSLRSVTFEKGSQLKYMVEGVFCDCEALTSIEIPASVEMIDMYYCINLANIYCYPSIPPILNDFRCKNFVLYVPSQSLEAYKNSSWSEYYSSIKTIQ